MEQDPVAPGPPRNVFDQIPDRWKQYEEHPTDGPIGRKKTHVPSALAGLDVASGRMPRQPYRDVPSGNGVQQPPGSADSAAAAAAAAAAATATDGGSSGFPTNPERFHDDDDDDNTAEAANDLSDDSPSNNKAGTSVPWSSRYTFSSPHLAMTQRIAYNARRQPSPSRNFRQGTQPNPLLGEDSRGSSSNNNNNNRCIPKGGSLVSAFAFRNRHVDEGVREEPNLRTAWKDNVLDDDDDYFLPETSGAPRTWQQALLSKKRRRRTTLVAGTICIAFLLCLVTIVTTRDENGRLRLTSGSQSDSTVTFYVTSDVPFDQSEADKLSKDLQNIPSSADFVVHLGNIQDAEVSMCSPSRYTDASSVLKTSPVPVLIVPGNEDWLKCPNPEESLEEWMDRFEHFEKEFDNVSNIQVLHQSKRPENFAVLHKGVLFFGLHLVNGQIPNEADWKEREEDMLKFLFGMLNLEKDQFRGLVLFGNARPGPQQERFFKGALKAIEKTGVPVAYIHANSGDGMVKEYTPFDDHDSVLGIQIQNGGSHPPLKVNVGFGDRPFIIG